MPRVVALFCLLLSTTGSFAGDSSAPQGDADSFLYCVGNQQPDIKYYSGAFALAGQGFPALTGAYLDFLKAQYSFKTTASSRAILCESSPNLAEARASLQRWMSIDTRHNTTVVATGWTPGSAPTERDQAVISLPGDSIRSTTYADTVRNTGQGRVQYCVFTARPAGGPMYSTSAIQTGVPLDALQEAWVAYVRATYHVDSAEGGGTRCAQLSARSQRDLDVEVLAWTARGGRVVPVDWPGK